MSSQWIDLIFLRYLVHGVLHDNKTIRKTLEFSVASDVTCVLVTIAIVFCMTSEPLWVHMCSCPAVSEGIPLTCSHPHPLALIFYLFHPYHSTMDLSDPWKAECSLEVFHWLCCNWWVWQKPPNGLTLWPRDLRDGFVVKSESCSDTGVWHTNACRNSSSRGPNTLCWLMLAPKTYASTIHNQAIKHFTKGF